MGEDDESKMNFPKFIMLIGLPGSGKSTWAEKYIKENSNTLIISSDKIRKELFNDENSQEDNNRVFYEMEIRTLQNLNNGVDVIYDATNVVRKRRKVLLDKLPTFVIKEAYEIWTPITVCIDRDIHRERHVGKDVINKFVKIYQPPFFDEGWDHINYLMNDENFDAEKFKDEIYSMMDEPHDNPHHTLDILEHCNKCERIMSTKQNVSKYLITAAKYHDCGKPFVKDFHNSKQEETTIAHYYNHQNVGSYLIPGLLQGDDLCTVINVSWLVNVHMEPYLETKYYKQLPTFLKKYIDLLHEADVEAH